LTAAASQARQYLHQGNPGVRRTFADGFRLVIEYPRQTLGPMLVILVPVGMVTAVALAAVYLTVFDDRDLPTIFDFKGDRSELFVLLILYGVELFFTVIAVGATIVSAAACARRSPIPLVEALDPAFTKIGKLLVIAIAIYLGLVFLIASIIGIPVALYLLVRLALSGQGYMLEGGGIREAFTQSWHRTRGHMRSLGALLILAALSFFGSLAVVGMIGVVQPGGRTAEIVTIAGVSILQSVVLIPVEAAIVAMMTLFYLNAKAQTHDVTTA
jgi:hypothetical protein